MKSLSVQEVFTQFCKERHAEDKGRNYNLLQEIYANTELFDLSKYSGKPPINRWQEQTEYKEDYIFYSDYLKNVDLPFANCFCKIMQTPNFLMYVFVREYEPQVYTGTFIISMDNGEIRVPFTVYTEGGYIAVEKSIIDKMWQYFGKLQSKADYMNFALDTVLVLCNLPKHSVVADTPKNQATYYPMKKAQGIKVVNRPIYYVLEKKNADKIIKGIRAVGNLEYTHAFKVRGHYMKINPKSMGKDRNGNRSEKMLGITWRTEYIKGEGELVKKIRICK